MPHSHGGALPSLPPQALTDLNRYLSYGWEPHVIAKLLRRLHGRDSSPDDVRTLIIRSGR